MTLWEPLPDTMSANARRLAVQLRRMKDRSGLAVPTLAARTSQSTESWERYLNGAKVPPRDAVEVLGQLCGADYERLGALWELAEHGGGTYVPDPDPLDPLAPGEGLPKPHRWRRRLLVSGFGLVPAAALGLLVLRPHRGQQHRTGPGARHFGAPGGGSHRHAAPRRFTGGHRAGWRRRPYAGDRTARRRAGRRLRQAC